MFLDLSIQIWKKQWWIKAFSVHLSSVEFDLQMVASRMRNLHYSLQRWCTRRKCNQKDETWFTVLRYLNKFLSDLKCLVKTLKLHLRAPSGNLDDLSDECAISYYCITWNKGRLIIYTNKGRLKTYTWSSLVKYIETFYCFLMIQV